jgi:hypothetical protein
MEPDNSEVWIAEAERRMEAVRAGRMPLIDAEEVLADPDFDDDDISDTPPAEPVAPHHT